MPSPRDLERLKGVHPELVRRLSPILDGLKMVVIQGVRTVAQQQALYAQGRTAPGAIVTYKDGVVHKSNHQPHDDGYGHAVDCGFYGPDPFAESHDWEAYGRAVEAAGLRWGGHFHGLVDRPHAELV